ncbi:AI-2E family transporter [Rossellomorea sp. BNER]|jgi:predicted PurR-regulated permease PerM|uniref:AI-2E family transporter n=1 Tax=Rossellomorea sp. BNER TaxID=2962031 RepID=UPI003AF29DE0|nr:AI-2E family transporter [Rossellomorea sp. BNER]
MPKGKWFRAGYGIALLLLIVYLGSLVDFIFTPITVIVTTLFAPIIIAGVLYYLLRPLVLFLSRYIPRSLSIILIYLMGIGIITALVYYLGPLLQRQINGLINNTPQLVDDIQHLLLNLKQNDLIERFQEGQNFSFEEIARRFTDELNAFLSTLGSNIIKIISTVTSILVLIVIIPFVLFYMLKDGDRLPQYVLKLVPKQHEKDGKRILKDMDDALSSYIQGQIIVSLCVGVLIYIGFLIIGLDYSLVLALVAMFTNVIPFVGPFIGTIPSLVVAFLDSPLMALWVLLVVIVVQQIESNFISPQVMGKKLDVHPLTIILLLLAAGNFAGLLGLILAVPTYAVSKVIVVNVYRFIQIRRISKE